MKKYLFKYEETNIGCIEVYAENEEEARDLAYCCEGSIHIHKSDVYVGDLIEEV